MENDMTSPAPDASQGASPAASADVSASPATDRPGALRGTRRWLVKTEPGAYSFADLVREGRTRWEGVENPLALIHLRSMRAGDLVLVYHTGSEKSVVGLARVVKGPYEDPAAAAGDVAGAPPAKPARKRRRKSGQPEVEGPRHAVVDLEAVAQAQTPV
jgi:predicted RNA-binding protein with PUA-like domain